MPKAVVDSSVTIKWFVDEEFTAEADQLLTDLQNGALEALAQDFLIIEIGNILWKKERAQLVSEAEARIIMNGWPSLPITWMASHDLLDDTFHLAVRHGRTLYDSLYLALSVRENCPFITRDEKLVNAVQRALPQVLTLSQWVQQNTP